MVVQILDTQIAIEVIKGIVITGIGAAGIYVTTRLLTPVLPTLIGGVI
jgi:hypothetical protein